MSTISLCAQFVRDLKELSVIDEDAVGTFNFKRDGVFSFGIIFNEYIDSEDEETITRGVKELFPAHDINIQKDECGIYFEVS